MMKELLMAITSPGLSPTDLRRDLHGGAGAELDARRAIIAVSLVGVAAMGVVSLLQTGVIKHLPDPPIRRPKLDTDRINLSEEAYSYGLPDGPLTVALHGANMVLAAAGPSDRWRKRPFLPVLASLLSAGQAAVVAQYLFYQMPKVERAWCPWCVLDALTHFATFALTLPESIKAVRHYQAAQG